MRIVYDFKLKKPGCVLLQALLGGTIPDFAKRFPGDWVIDLTPDLKLYEVNEQQLAVLEEIHRNGTTKK